MNHNSPPAGGPGPVPGGWQAAQTPNANGQPGAGAGTPATGQPHPQQGQPGTQQGQPATTHAMPMVPQAPAAAPGPTGPPAPAPGTAGYPTPGAPGSIQGGHFSALGPPGTHPTAVPLPPTTSRKRSRAGLITALVALGCLVIGGVVAAVVLLWPHGLPPSLPLEVGQLPTKTMRITRIAAGISQARATYMPPDQLPDEAMWSYYAELCGGFDVYEQVMDASLGMSRRTAARTLNREPSKHRSTLTCAKSLAESAGRDRGVYFVRFADSKESKENETPKEDKYKSRHSKSDKKEYQREHNVALFNLDVKELPGTIAQFRTSSDVANLSHIRCLLKWKDEPDKECKPRARTVANLPDNDLWIIGSGNGIKQFGNEYAPDGSNSSVRVNDLSELTQQLGNYELITVAAAELFSSSDVTFRKVDSVMYGEDEAKELQKTVREQAEVFGRGRRNLLGDSSFRLIIIADSDGSAKDIHNALQNYHGKLKTKLAKKKRRTLDKDTPQQVREFLLVKHRMALRALEQAELSRQDRRIVYAATQESKTTELKAQETYTKWRLEKSALTVKILLALAQGEAPKEEDIREVGGEKLVAEMQVEKALAKLDWPDSAYPFHDNKDIYIPTGGNYKPKYDSGKFIHRYRYKKSKRVLEKAFRALSKARGWKFMEHDGELYMDKGSERVKVRLEEESWNSSTLTLISQ